MHLRSQSRNGVEIALVFVFGPLIDSGTLRSLAKIQRAQVSGPILWNLVVRANPMFEVDNQLLWGLAVRVTPRIVCR